MNAFADPFYSPCWIEVRVIWCNADNCFSPSPPKQILPWISWFLSSIWPPGDYRCAVSLYTHYKQERKSISAVQSVKWPSSLAGSLFQEYLRSNRIAWNDRIWKWVLVYLADEICWPAFLSAVLIDHRYRRRRCHKTIASWWTEKQKSKLALGWQVLGSVVYV